MDMRLILQVETHLNEDQNVYSFISTAFNGNFIEKDASSVRQENQKYQIIDNPDRF